MSERAMARPGRRASTGPRLRQGAGGGAGAYARERGRARGGDERADEHAGEEQGELFGEESVAENRDEERATRHPWAWLLRRVFAAHVLVCVYCAGKLRIVEIATEPEATKRIARDERRRRGEAVESGSALEARGPPRVPPRGPAGPRTFTFW
jgi:hypothetical protein